MYAFPPPPETFALVVFTYMKEVWKCKFKGSINFSVVILLLSMFPLSLSVHLCFVCICVFSSLYWQSIFQNFAPGKMLSTSSISLFHPFTIVSFDCLATM